MARASPPYPGRAAPARARPCACRASRHQVFHGQRLCAAPGGLCHVHFDPSLSRGAAARHVPPLRVHDTPIA
eukprot:1647888-Pleurochrysis_carterae.AAC.1